MQRKNLIPRTISTGVRLSINRPALIAIYLGAALFDMANKPNSGHSRPLAAYIWYFALCMGYDDCPDADAVAQSQAYMRIYV